MDNLIALTVPGGRNNAGVELKPVAGMPSGGLLDVTLPAILTYLFIGAGLLALAFMIIGGIRWITSGGDKHGVETARKTVIYAAIGLVVVLSSYIIISLVGNLFGVRLLNTPRQINQTRCGGTQFGTCPARQVCIQEGNRYRCGCNPRTPGCAF
jgi:hypothetical protein